MVDDPRQSMSKVALAAEAKLTVATLCKTSLPKQAAGDWISFGVMGEALLCAPTPADIGQFGDSVSIALGHAPTIRAVQRSFLFGALASKKGLQIGRSKSVHCPE
jgi:hypothetical protein